MNGNRCGLWKKRVVGGIYVEKQLVVFDLAGEQYGVSIFAVSSIIERQDIVMVPRSPEFVEGVTNLRGLVVPVIDLRKRFGLPVSEATAETRIVVVELDDMTVGMLVDAVRQVLRIDDGEIEPPSPIVATIDSSFIVGIAKTEQGLVIVLDLCQVLDQGEQGDLVAMDTLAVGESSTV